MPVKDKAAVEAAAARLRPGDKLAFAAPLAPGDYVMRVRARPTQPDVFNAVEVRVNGVALEPLCVTVPAFTRHRRYFHLGEPGAEIELSLREGPAVVVDRFRIAPAFENARIKKLKPMHMDTTLVANGQPAARIVVPDDGRFDAHARRLAQMIETRAGAALPVVRSRDVKRGDYAKFAHLVLGTYLNNPHVWELHPNAWGRAAAPEPGAFAVRTFHNPMGLGRNAIALLASDAAGMDKALAAVEPKLAAVMPKLTLPEPPALTDARKREIVVEAGKHMRQNLRGFLTRWKRYGPEGFRLLAYRYFEHMDSRDTIKTDLYHSGFADAELHKLVTCWDQVEETGYYNDLERLAITNALFEIAEFCQFPYQKYLWGQRRRMSAAELLAFARQQKPALRWNHQQFPAYSLFTAAQYFGTYYRLPEAAAWFELARICFEPMRAASKAGEDCWGYQDITMVQCLRYFAAIGDADYLRSGALERFLRLRLISMDNLGSAVNYGDSTPYAAPREPGWQYRDDTHRSFLSTPWRPDHAKIDFDSTLGVYVHPVDPLFAERFDAPKDAAIFDKICFRTAVDPSRHYLLLDGISRSHHGHWDGNSINRFFDNGRCFLVEGDYLNGDLKDHNTLTFSRDGESAYPPLFSLLAGRAETPRVGLTRTVTPDYNGSTWTRNIVWAKDRYFVVLDELKAERPGAYDASVRWRSLGKVTRNGSRVSIEQAGGEVFHLINADGARILLRDDAADGKKNWRRYPHAAPITRLISHRFVGEIPAGGRHVFQNLFYVAGPAEKQRFELRPISEGCALVVGDDVALVGTGTYKAGPIDIAAGLFYISANELVAAACTRLNIAGVEVGESVAADLTRPQFAELRKQVAAHLEALRAASRPAEPRRAERPAEAGLKQTWSRNMGAKITAIEVADIDADGSADVVVGCADGRLAVLDAAGKAVWERQLDHRINDIALGCVRGAKTLDIAVGCDGQSLVVLDSAGKELWRATFEAGHGGPGNVLRCAIGDFDGDGKGEVAAGLDCAQQHVLDDDGQRLARFEARHDTNVLEAADVDGNGCDDLAIGVTYTERLLVYFYPGGRNQRRAFGASISGCSSVAFADLTGDGKLEAIYAGKDAGLRVCKPDKKNRYRLAFVWQKYLGSDALTKVVAMHGGQGGRPGLAVASMDGFVARLEADGKIEWIRYVGESVFDLATAAGVLYAAADDAVLMLSRDGRVTGCLRLGGPISGVRTTSDKQCVVAQGERVMGVGAVAK